MGRSKVMVVEDHPMSRKILEKMLQKNYTVIAACSGQEALVLAADEKPDLVLLDIEMPGMDGFQTFEALREGVINQAVPVIFLTAREDSQSRGKGLEAGAVDYITKPYDKDELSIKVKNHLALYEARKEIERKNRIMAQEMEMASQLQRSLLPQSFPENDRVHFSVVYLPTSRASGDFYDLIDLPERGIGFAQVDVSGHGVHSAMIGAMFKMALQTLVEKNTSPAGLLSIINDEMFRVLPDSEFLTVFYGIIDTQSLALTFCNAGHPKPFLLRRKNREIVELEDGGPLVGAFPGMEYDEGSVALEPGDRILIFTDGVTEATGVAGSNVFYGESRLKDVFLKSADTPPADALHRIFEDLVHYHAQSTFDDDISMLLISVQEQ